MPAASRPWFGWQSPPVSKSDSVQSGSGAPAARDDLNQGTSRSRRYSVNIVGRDIGRRRLRDYSQFWPVCSRPHGKGQPMPLDMSSGSFELAGNVTLDIERQLRPSDHDDRDRRRQNCDRGGTARDQKGREQAAR